MIASLINKMKVTNQDQQNQSKHIIHQNESGQSKVDNSLWSF